MIRTNFIREEYDMFSTGVVPDDTLKFDDISSSILPGADTGRYININGSDPFEMNSKDAGDFDGIASKDARFPGIAEGVSFIESMLGDSSPSIGNSIDDGLKYLDSIL